MPALETAGSALLALAIAAAENPAPATGEHCDPARLTANGAAGLASAACAPAVARRELKWESVARLTIGKPPRAPRV